MVLGIIFALSLIFNANFNFNGVDGSYKSDYREISI